MSARTRIRYDKKTAKEIDIIEHKFYYESRFYFLHPAVISKETPHRYGDSPFYPE
jgi:hypothetical protein